MSKTYASERRYHKKKKKEKYTRYNLVIKIFQIHLEA